MAVTKIEVNLTGVPKTLLLPLLARAKFSREIYSPIHDSRALEIVKMLDYDFNRLLKEVGSKTLVWIARAYQFDEAIKAFLKKYPNAVIVNLGAGLETAFYRVDNGTLTWVDLDFPQVIALRKKLFTANERIHSIAKSVLDFSWMDDVAVLGKPVFFFAGGLFMYLTESEVKSFFFKMANHFPNAELIFYNISRGNISYANKMLRRAQMSNALLQWGIDDPSQLTAWSPHIKILAAYSYFKNIRKQFKFPLKDRLIMLITDWVDKGGIIHVKFVR